MKKCLFTTSILFACILIQGQNVKFNNGLEGFWSGALIKNGNSAQIFNVNFYQEEDSVKAAFSIPDWGYYAPEISTVEKEGRVVKFQSYYGPLILVWDSAYAEMVGECDFANVHMKKALHPPQRKIEKISRVFDLGGIQLEGTITKPAGKGPFPTAIIVHGRGCGSKDDWSERPGVFANYGLAVVTFDKRGHERTGFPCGETTMEMHTKDLVEVTRQVKKLSFVNQLGYIGYSAGGWTAPRAAASSKVPVDFMVTVVGPSTSVKQQQIDCAIYYLRDELGLNQKAIDEVLEYTELEFADSEDNANTYDRMMQLLDSAEVNGWKDVLVEDDIPSSKDALDQLWVRRNRYNPGNDLASFEGPFLSVLGGNDYVVPYKENRDRFVEIFEDAGKKNYQVSIIPSAGHGMEHWHELRDLKYEPSIKKWHTYFKFDRVAAGAVDEIIVFLREYGFIE